MLSSEKILLVSLFVFYCILGTFGYGTDNDAYGLLHTGYYLATKGVYYSSRFQGYLVPEVLASLAAKVGGHYLSNALSAGLAVGTLAILGKLLQNSFSVQTLNRVYVVIGLSPIYILAATSTMDYIYSLFFLLCVIYFLQRKKLVLAALFSAFVISSRLSNGPLVGVIYFYFLSVAYNQNKKELLEYFLSGCLGIFLSVVLYFPIIKQSGLNAFSFAIGEWDLFGYFSRFVYKNFNLMGFIPALFFYSVLCYQIYLQRGSLKEKLTIAYVFCGIGFVISELVFMKAPIETAYLLPALFLVVPAYFVFVESNILQKTLCILVLFNNIMFIDFLQIMHNEDGTEALSAKVGFFVKKGLVVKDLQERKKAYKKFMTEEMIDFYGK